MSSKKIDKDFMLELNCIPEKRLIWIGSGQNEQDSGVDRELSRKVILAISSLDSLKEHPIILIINCSGGDELDGIAIYDAISMCRSHVTAVICGGACSAAAVFLQAADERLITQNSWILIHDGSYQLPDDNVADNEITHRFFKKLTKQYRTLLNSKAKIAPKKLQKMLERDTWLNAEQSVKIGLVDKIIKSWGEALNTKI